MKIRILALLLSLLLVAPLCALAEAELPVLIGEFKTTDIHGSELDQTLLQNAGLTFVNIWGTFCPPCIDEMPSLGKLAEEFSGRVQFIGIVGDVYTPDGPDADLVQLAIEIAEQTGADNYAHLIPSVELVQLPLSSLRVYPTSFMVDGDGRLVGNVYEGSRSEEEWRKIIEETYAQIAAN